jgi:hypothetical protein
MDFAAPAAPAAPAAAPPLWIDGRPAEAIRINDLYRAGAGQGSGLWTLDQFAAAMGDPADIRVPAFRISRTRSPYGRGKNQERYSSDFRAEFPVVAEILPIPGVYVVGGAAAVPLGSTGAGDVDLFIVGVDDPWATLNKVVTRLRRACDKHYGDRGHRYSTSETLSPGIFNYAVYEPGQGALFIKVQVVLRAYPDLSRLLHGIDIPCAAVAFDGVRTQMTYLAAWAHYYGSNIVNPAYRSATYEERCLKYAERGYSLKLMHMRQGIFQSGRPIELTRILFNPQSQSGDGNFAEGVVALRPSAFSGADKSYDFIAHAQSIALINVDEVMTGRGRYVLNVAHDAPIPRGATLGDVLSRAQFIAAAASADVAVYDAAPQKVRWWLEARACVEPLAEEPVDWYGVENVAPAV